MNYICDYCHESHDPGELCDARKDAIFGFKNDKPKRKRNQSETSFLQDQIIAHVKENKGIIWRINTMGIYRPGKKYENITTGRTVEEKGKWTTSGATIGVSDLVGLTDRGIILCIEVKSGRDKMRHMQVKRQKEVVDRGGIFIIAKTFEQFKAEFQQKLAIFENE